jgi:IS5 family transposase
VFSGIRFADTPSLIVSALMLLLVAKVVRGFTISGFWTAFFASIFITVLGFIFGLFLPDGGTTWHLLEEKGLTDSIFNAINAHLAEKGLFMRQGTVVDATIIAAPPSTKNRTGERDPDMHQTKKGNQWHFGMKAHIGVDAESGLTHTVIGTAANVNDVTQAQALLHGDETDVFGDAGYQGVEKREENLELPVTWHVAMKPSKRRALPKTLGGEMLEWIEHAKVEHPFHVVKNLFRHRKTRYQVL